MGRIADDIRYPYDQGISNEDRLVGTDANDSEITKSFRVSDLIAFISGQVSGTSSDNIFQEVDLGTMNEGDSISALANALASYTITETGLALYTVSINPTTADGLTRDLTYVTLLKGKGTYGVGGSALVDADFYLINPTQLEMVRNSIVVENLISVDKILFGNVVYSGAGLVFESTPYSFIIGGTVYNVAANNNITLSVGGAQPRRDVIAGDTSGNIIVIEGTEAASPVKPSLTDFDNQIELTEVSVAAFATTPTGVSEENMYYEFAGEPTEWTVTESTAGARISLNSALDPYAGSVSIRIAAPISGDNIIVTNDVSVSMEDYTHLAFRVKLDSVLPDGFTFRVIPKNAGVRTIRGVLLRHGAFGLDGTNTTDYQLIAIPFSAFGSQINFDSFTFVVRQADQTETIYIDSMRLVIGITTVSSSITPTNTSDLINDGEDGVNPFVTALDFLVEPISNPIDVYFGERLKPTIADEGFYAESANNKDVGFLANNTNIAGNAAIAGFRATVNGDVFGEGVAMTVQNDSYYAPWLRGHGLISAKNLNILVQDNTGDIVFSLGNTGTNQITEAQQDKVLLLNSNRTIVAPSLTTALISAEPTGKVLITKEWVAAQFTASNGITKTAYDFALGGNLTGNTTINSGSSSLLISGSNTGSSGIFKLYKTGTGIAFSVDNQGTGGGITLDTASTTFFDIPLYIRRLSTTLNGALPHAEYVTQPTTPAIGDGVAIRHSANTIGGSNTLLGYYAFSWENATAGVGLAAKYQIVQTIANSETLSFEIDGAGQISAPFYGAGTHTGTPAYSLQVDASGNIIEGLATPTLDSVTDANNVTTNQVYLGKVWTSNIQNNDTADLLISGNNDLILRSHNANTGTVQITSNGAIASLTNGETINGAVVSRLYNDTLTNSNNIFHGLKISDTVDMSLKTTPTYIALKIQPALTAGGTIRSIVSDNGDAIFNNGYVQADDFRLNALNSAPASASATGTTGEIRYTASYIYVCTATDTWVRAAVATW